jgi:hypothetical protein
MTVSWDAMAMALGRTSMPAAVRGSRIIGSTPTSNVSPQPFY